MEPVVRPFLAGLAGAVADAFFAVDFGAGADVFSADIFGAGVFDEGAARRPRVVLAPGLTWDASPFAAC